MPCYHKFQKYLNLDRIDFEPEVLIIGTFNPAWPQGNNAEWFYGRTRNNYFWDVLPRIYDGNINLRKQGAHTWKTFCHDNGIALTDIITSINDAVEENEKHHEILKTYLDQTIADYFQDFTFTNIVDLLAHYPTISSVYFTRQPGINLFDQQWELVKEYAAENGKNAINLMTPSASARFQIGQYRRDNPKDKTPLRNFIFREWDNAWHH